MMLVFCIAYNGNCIQRFTNVFYLIWWTHSYIYKIKKTIFGGFIVKLLWLNITGKFLIHRFIVFTRLLRRCIFSPILIDKYVFPALLYAANNFNPRNPIQLHSNGLQGIDNFLKVRISKSLILWQIDWQESCRLQFH